MLYSVGLPSIVFADAPGRIVRGRRDDMNFVSTFCQPRRHLARVFPDPRKFRREVQTVKKNAQRGIPQSRGDKPRSS